MTRLLDQRILLLVISCLTRLQSTKVLSEWKKCGDRECETAMSRVQATTDYLGPDCRYLNFKAGEEIMVYSKLSRKNENLWTGSKGKDFGYFPKDAVKVEEVLIADEVEVLTKEADFLCLHGDQYAFENEDNALKDHNKESEYSSSDVELKLQENELLKYTRDSMEKEERVVSVSLNDSTESHTQEESASKEFIRKNENRQDETEEPQMQNSVPLKPVPTQSSWIAGWFTTESKNNEEPLKVTTESLEENTYRGRKLAVTDENYLQEPSDKEEQEPPASIWFQGGLTDFLYLEEKNVGVDLASENNDPQIHEASSVPGHSNNQPETALTELLTEEEKTGSQESMSNWFNLGLSNVLNFGHTEKDTIAMEDQQSRETEDETNKNEEVQTSDQKESHTDKESKETVKAVTEEDEENYAQDMIVSNSNVPNSGETPANMHTLDDTKSTSNSTESSFDIQTDDKEKSNEPYTSEEDLVSESQLLKNTEAEKRNQESEKKHGHSGWYTSIYNSFINYNMNTNDNQQGHESVASDQIPSPPSSPQTCDPSDTKNIEEKPDIAEEQSHFSFSSFADMLMFWSSTANEEQVQSLQDEVLSSEETPQAENADEILQGKNNRAMKLQANQRNSEEGSEKDEDAVQESSLSSSLAVQNNERVNEKAKHIVKLVSDSDASQVLSAETQVQPEEYQNQYVPWFSYFSAVGHVSKSSESQENTNIKGYYNDAVYKDSLHLHSKLNLENTVDTGTRLQGKPKMETVETVQKEQNNLNTYIHQSVNSENDLQSYGELPGTADDHLGMKKTPHDGEQGLTLETSEKGKPVKCCDTKQNSALKSQFKKDGDVKEKTHKLENKNNPLGFHENNIKDFSEVSANDEQDQNSEDCQEVPPDQLLSPQHSSNRFSLRGTKTSEEAGDLEGMWSFRMEGAGSRRKLLEKTPEKEHEMNIAVDSECDDDHHSEATAIPSVNSEENADSSVADSPFDVEKPSLDAIQNYVPSSGGWTHQILLCLNALEIGELIKSVFSAVTSIIKTALASLPEVMRPGPDLYGFPWEVVICTGIVGAFTILLFLYRSYQSIRSRLYVGREKQLANKIAELVEEKCKLLEKLSLGQKEFKDLELSLKDGNIMKESTEASVYKEMLENLKKLKLELNQEIENLEKELKEEKSTQSEYGNLEAELQERLESLENEEKSTQSQTDEAKSTLKVYQINTERLKTSLQDAVDENSHLQESAKQLFQEAERWHERISELNEQIKIFSSSKADVEEVLKNKESQVKSLTQYLLKMKDWSSAITDDDDEDNHWDTDIKGETENGEHLDDQQKRTVKKLIYAAKLSARLKTLETERDQMYSKLSDENKAKGELAECIENLQSQQASLQSENDRLESEVQKLQQKLKVMTELYQENEMKLHRKLTVAERERLQKEEKLSKVDEKINHAAEELNSYRQRAKDLEEELERTIRSYQNQITSLEKKSHDNWLTARAAERHLDNIKKENAQNRQKLTEAEFKLDLLEKDPYALDVPVRPFGREHSPYGPSPMGRPSSETRAFLSPPTLLEGPLRLSPMLPGGGGGGRGSRGPAAMNEAGNERGELNSDRLTDPHRPPSDTGSLSPPWDRERRIILPPPVLGEPYTDPALPPQRQEGFFPNPPSTGRLSGPAELRTYNMQSFDKTDGQTSSENSPLTEPSGNEMKDHSNPSNSLPDQSLACESETISSGFAPPPFPPVRPPLMPVDTRAPFVRRGPPFPPPPPPGMYGPRECFPVRDFGHLRPPLPIRNQFPMRPYPHYPPQ